MAKKLVSAQKGEKAEVERWHSRIVLATKFRDSENRKTAWKNMKKYYRNFFGDNESSVNLIFSHGRQLIPLLYFKNPVVELTALWPGYEWKAKILEAVDNKLLETMRVKEQLKLIIQDGYLYDYGIRKIGYDSQFGYDPTASLWRQVFQDLGIVLEEEELQEFNTYITTEMPFFLRVPPKRFGVDPDIEGPSLDTAEWCFEEFYRPLEDVVEDDRYTIPKDLRASHLLSTDVSGNVVVSPKTQGYPTEGGTKKSDVERLKMFEVWDKRSRKVYIIADGCSTFLREQDDVWNYKNFFPYDRLYFNPVSDEHYSTSDAMYVERQQLDYNDGKTQETIHRRRANTRVLAKAGAFLPEDKERFNSGAPFALCEVQGNPTTDLVILSPNMSRDIFAGIQEVRQDFQEILAMGRNQLSQEMGKRKTASEAMIIQQYVELRSDERRDIIADFLSSAIMDTNRLIFKFWDVEDVIEVVGPEGAQWVEWTGDKLEGEYAIKIIPNSTLPTTKELYRQKVQQLVQIHGQNPNVNQRELTRLHLDSFEEFDTSRLLLPIPNMQQAFIGRPGQPKHGEEPLDVPAGPPTEQDAANLGQGQAAELGTEMGGVQG